ncbi:MAG TPA: indolepyruvate oxidoreductase subunit beta, partial [Methanomicrobiales archaeon]|nr:indolepyruvate oxidoreductase subunit beta [Methanomicrobiales archaeon]
MTGSYDLLIVGTGGQGVILASNVIGEACLIEGRSVKAAETHGMAQRGGSVECHVRIDGKFGPLIPPGGADLLMAFELIEALRYRHYLKPGGRLVANRLVQVPTSVFMQKLEAPTEEGILGRLADLTPCILDADAKAVEAGSPLTQNMVMVGAGSLTIPLRVESLEEAVRRSVPEKTIEMNLRAFRLGREAAGG